MFARILVVALNTYREAVRARILHGLFGLAVLTGAYAAVVGECAVQATTRVVGDLGAASVSIYALTVDIVLGATSLYRELELKTIFPILARPLRRTEYLVGKFLGTTLTLAVFISANSGVLLLVVAFGGGTSVLRVLSILIGTTALASLIGWKMVRWRSYIPMVWAVVLLLAGWLMAVDTPDDRRVVLGAAALTLCEVGIVTALATVFASFSSPFLTAVFTFSVFLVGRSADTLGRLPARLFGDVVHGAGVWLSKVVPNLMLYVPPRTLLTGEGTQQDLIPYVMECAVYATFWCVGLLAVASMIFKKRDFI